MLRGWRFSMKGTTLPILQYILSHEPLRGTLLINPRVLKVYSEIGLSWNKIRLQLKMVYMVPKSWHGLTGFIKESP
ncbi:hypothetical protein A3L14_07645 [Thermococcus thioreducens]|uniref:Uncharacterized protein n=1 Tax=Thermococcus thioreducens TaxID=277988 RepID=A0A2Z2N4P2_9EURY|nr:hypothetical protein A3L14_07645 [Thermococcus thioreducens]